MTLCSDWTNETAVELCYTIPEGTSQDVIDNSITASSEILYALTGRQFPGTCSQTLRPCGNAADPYGFQPWLWSYPWVPMRYDGQWVNTGPCGCHMRSCGCKPYSSVNLGRDDIQSVTAVKVNGVVQAPGSYRLDSQQYLTALASRDPWPCCQDLSRADTAEGTWSVTVTYGNAIPQALKTAAATLAAEFIKDCVGEECRLDPRITVVSRQGADFELGNLPTGGVVLTGIAQIDNLIRAYNPNGLARRAMAWSPETSGRAIRT